MGAVASLPEGLRTPGTAGVPPAPIEIFEAMSKVVEKRSVTAASETTRRPRGLHRLS
jgi:hypothetical protein